MRWTALRRRNCPHLIRHGFAVPPSPHMGRHLVPANTEKLSRKKVQTSKSGLHLLLTANVLRQLAANLAPRIRRRAAETRRVTSEWNDARNIGSCLNAEAGSTKRILKRPFLPYLFLREGKDRAAGGTSETTTTERILASKASYPLCSFLPFQTAN